MSDEGSAVSTVFDHIDRSSRAFEVASAVLLSLATLASAWAAYQATRWSGVQSVSFGEANSRRSESVRASTLAGQQATVDVGLWVQWVTAVSKDETRLADFLEERFREEFRPAFEAWLDQPKVAGTNVPPGTPFDMPEYRLEATVESERLAEEAAAKFEDAKKANQTGDNFVLTAVLFASTLFFAGIGSRFTATGPRMVTVVLGLLMFGIGSSIMFTLPQNVGF